MFQNPEHLYVQQSVPNGDAVFSSMKPYLYSNESAYPMSYLNSKLWNRKKRNPGSPLADSIIPELTFKKKLKARLLYGSLISVNDSAEKFSLNINLLFDLSFGRDLSDSVGEKIYSNTRGVQVKGSIGNKFAFESSFLENQSTFVQYLDSFCQLTKVTPGYGRWKTFKLNGYDYAMAGGYISWSPHRKYNLQAGHGKHFIGDGYRSLLLSDFSFNYPFLRSTFRTRKFQYTNIYAVLMNLTDGGVTTPPYTERLFQKKAAQFQYLNWQPVRWIQLGFFQGMIWEAADTLNRQHLTPGYFSPVIYSQTLAYGLRKKYNVLLGLNMRFRITRDIAVYAQFMLDDMGTSGFSGDIHNKYGFQAGLKYFDLFTIKNLYLQFEYNRVNPYSYAHVNAEQSFTHYNQTLAHPLGANFSEICGRINYRYNNVILEIGFMSAEIGRDTNYLPGYLSSGNNPLESDYKAYYGVNGTQNIFLQGLKTDVLHVTPKLGYVINSYSNLIFWLSVDYRNFSNLLGSRTTTFFKVGLKSDLFNHYHDF